MELQTQRPARGTVGDPAEPGFLLHEMQMLVTTPTWSTLQSIKGSALFAINLDTLHSLPFTSQWSWAYRPCAHCMQKVAKA